MRAGKVAGEEIQEYIQTVMTTTPVLAQQGAARSSRRGSHRPGWSRTGQWLRSTPSVKPVTQGLEMDGTKPYVIWARAGAQEN